MVTKKDIMKGYDKIAHKIGMYKEFYPACVKLAGHINGNVLDVGCGQGSLIKEIISCFPYVSVFGCDISFELCRISAKKNPEAIIIQSDAENLSFADGYFDFVFMTEVLEHLLNPAKALQEVSRVLEASGNFLLTVPNRDWLRYRAYKKARENYQPVDPVDDYWFNFDEVRSLLLANNFVIKKVKGEESLYFSGRMKKIERIGIMLLPTLNKRMKRLMVLCEKR